MVIENNKDSSPKNDSLGMESINDDLSQFTNLKIH